MEKIAKLITKRGGIVVAAVEFFKIVCSKVLEIKMERDRRDI